MTEDPDKTVQWMSITADGERISVHVLDRSENVRLFLQIRDGYNLRDHLWWFCGKGNGIFNPWVLDTSVSIRSVWRFWPSLRLYKPVPSIRPDHATPQNRPLGSESGEDSLGVGPTWPSGAGDGTIDLLWFSISLISRTRRTRATWPASSSLSDWDS
jgi:hypothetical protein